MSDVEEVICGAHGSTPSTYVCRHVASGVACGFHPAEITADDAWPDAWCDLCEETLNAAGEWTDEASAVADLRVLCTHCYEAARACNQTVPPLARGAVARFSPDEEAELVHHALHAIQDRQAAAVERWGLGRWARWDFDRSTRSLKFSNPDGAGVVADARWVGTYSTRSHTFQWAWETLGARDPAIGALASLRAFGEVRGVARLTTANWKAEVADGWAMTSLAGYLLGCEAVYLAPSEHVLSFLLLDKLRPIVAA